MVLVRGITNIMSMFPQIVFNIVVSFIKLYFISSLAFGIRSFSLQPGLSMIALYIVTAMSMELILASSQAA